jgi:PD-(D/E)XK nuclease superfamily protein
MELRQKHPRRQGDIGEAIAASWLTQTGYGVWVPFGHSPDCDLIAQDETQLLRIQVKTCTMFRNERWEVSISTRGGNRSWNGLVKHLERDRYDYLFVVVADWRCWFIPSGSIDAKSMVRLGGPKYAPFEISAPCPPRRRTLICARP